MRKLDSKVVFDGKWTQLITSSWEFGKARGVWEYVTRKGDGRGIVIVPFFIKDGVRHFILIKQKRVPFDSYVIEFPAGLVDEGEELIGSALRELKEETGAEGKIVELSPPLSTSAGLSDEVIHIVVVEVSHIGKSEVEESEDIETIIVPEDRAEEFLKELPSSYIIDGKVWMLLKGF